MKNLIQKSGLAFVLAVSLGTGGRLQAAALQTNSSLNQTNMLQMQTNSLQLGQQFLAMRQQRQAEIAAQDEELTQLVAQMNTAAPDQKLETMAAIITKLVEERVASHQRHEALKTRLLEALTDVGANGTNGVPDQGTNQIPQQAFPPTSPSIAPQNSLPVLPQQLR